MSLYRKKPVVIEAFRLSDRGLIAEDWFWDAVTRNDIITHCFGKHEPSPAWCEIKTLEGVMVAKSGDYIIRGVNGEIYPCKADIFLKTYEKAIPSNEDRCVCCGAIIPEGQMVCPNCLVAVKERDKDAL